MICDNNCSFITKSHVQQVPGTECDWALLSSLPTVELVRRVSLTMCRALTRQASEEVLSARKVVRKYRKLSLKREMKRLKLLVNAPASVPSEEVLDRTVDLISQLEARLISQIREKGLPDKMAGMMGQMGLQWDSSMDMMRDVVGQMMAMSSR